MQLCQHAQLSTLVDLADDLNGMRKLGNKNYIIHI